MIAEIFDEKGAMVSELVTARKVGAGKFIYPIEGQLLEMAYKVRFSRENGARTSFAYIIRPYELRQSTRSGSSKSISRAYEAFQSGMADLVQFMNVLQMLRNEELSAKHILSWQGSQRTSKSESAGEREEPAETVVKLSLEEYFRGREKYSRTATGRSGILSVNDASYADMFDILRAATFGSTIAAPEELPDGQTDEIYEDEENISSELTGQGGGQGIEGNISAGSDEDEEQEREGDNKTEVNSAGEIEARHDRVAVKNLRDKLASQTQEFSTALRSCAKSGNVPPRMVLSFWLHLLTLVAGVREASGVRPLSTTIEEHREGYFPRLMAALLQYFYTYPNPSVFHQLLVEETADALPDDIFDLYAFSLWCCCLTVAIDRSNKESDLSKVLDTVSQNIYRTVVGTSGRIDISALDERIEQLNITQDGLPVSADAISEIHRNLISVAM